MTAPTPVLHTVQDRPVLVWRCEQPWLAIASAPRGGGIGLRDWVFNATVETDYDHPDPDAHTGEMATGLGLSGAGIGLLTAVDVRHEVTATDGGVLASVTTGANAPVWAAAPAEAEAWAPGTINAVCWSPVRLSDAALVNAVATIAEAKAQALAESGVRGTGTVTDATALLCPPDGPAEPYGGPRSTIGGSLARAVHAAVTAGLRVENPRRDTA
ncbi:adenosylcobinamide amidohydrolase [Saccharopolyspora rhizosphaerae]|uniref:Adenosylcobinamide amidohydrolase n=1 Tax=Saccharopolyspora rhizosphaerae TaxID=2492662 RepID=A0A426JHV0_9PSEU|nr:adenosylcobinamide amidohydrolase [Saccharopolyspora rhizosphaerae]RRO12768.1 adenosylcobinamide amidohydrolase [Saccharopolyspora rhizosphaerae]